MYTLQILDAGQTFLHTLNEQSVSLGTAEGANVRLRESGVAAIHVRLDPHPEGVRLTAEPDCDVVINGVSITQAELHLGDRIELGRAVMIVGRTVSRAAEPEDVLASGLLRAPRTRWPQTGLSKLVPILAGVAVLAVIVFMAMQGDDSAEIRGRLGDIEDARGKGDLDSARAQSARLRGEWAAATDDRLAKLDTLDAAIAKVEATHAALVAKVIASADSQTYAQWLRELQLLEARGAPDERVAARKLRSRLRETLMARTERIQKETRLANGGVGSRATGNAASGDYLSPTAGANASTQSNSTTDNNDVVVAAPAKNAEQIGSAEIVRLCNDGFYAQAFSLAQEALGQAANPAEVRSLQSTEQFVRTQAIAAMNKLIQDSRTSEREGRLQHALTLLQAGRHNYPSSSSFKPLGEEVFRLQETVRIAEQLAAAAVQAAALPQPGGVPGRVDEKTRLQTLESLRSHMAQVRAAEDRGDFAQQATLLREAADGVRSRDHEFADRLKDQAEEADLLAGWNEAVVAFMGGGEDLVVNDRRGQELQFLRVDGRRIVVRSADGELPLDWTEVDAVSMLALARQLKASGRLSLGLASLLYRNGDIEEAETVLVGVVRRDDAMQPKVDVLLARGRGEPAGELGYVLRKGEFVSLRKIELQKLSKRLLAKLATAMRNKDRNARGLFVRETLAKGGLQADALVFALRDQLAKYQGRIASSGVRKQVVKMVAEREMLDAARKHAKDLIYDMVRYFYPYRPPAVTGARHAEYNRVQAEVAERVSAVRAIWNSSKLKVRVPKQLGQDLDQLDWLVMHLSRLGGLPDGESSASVLEAMAWARALEPGVTITLRDFCLTPSERGQRAEWRRIEAYNVGVKDEFPVAVQMLLRITNTYRAMFGHRPLAAVKSACEGSQGHADEMSRLGYFSHTSPIPSRRTPRNRMKLAGYMFGVSENIAMTGGALGAHNAWCRSSGHHRNLLSASHREIGIGANGRYWVQNFGSGEVHKTHPAWTAQERR